MSPVDLAGQISAHAGGDMHFDNITQEDYHEYDVTLDPWYGYIPTKLDGWADLATHFKYFYGGRYADRHRSGAAWWSNISYSKRECYLNPDWISVLFGHLSCQINKQLDAQINTYPFKLDDYSLLSYKAICFNSIPGAAVFDVAVSSGVEMDSELVTLFLKAALHIGFINPFKEICFVSDRPRFKYDAQNNLHAEGEPAVIFPDSFGMDYFYHGTALPQYMGMVDPSRWRSEWILEEKNADVRRCLIQEIGYARICQELQAEELDAWREYSLLKIPIHDDYSRIPELRPWEKAEDVPGEAAYLLKMVCPSTGHLHGIRVPPDMRSARDAATWINWGSDPTWFTLET
ncbi:MAG: hypothetical protein HC860_23220 [Alkalinema sp. RU_4_3]|nr:hypothetical protein [Alkalinema sp. RU_4_3]